MTPTLVGFTTRSRATSPVAPAMTSAADGTGRRSKLASDSRWAG